MKALNLTNSKRYTFNIVKKAATNLGLELEKESYKTGKLNLYHSGNFFSFGNKIDVSILETNKTKCSVKISSRSSAAIQILDWGTNKELEEQLSLEIQKIMKL